MRKGPNMDTIPTEPKQKVSRFAIAGAVLFPFGFLMLLLFIPTIMPAAIHALLIAIGVIAIITSTALGVLSIRQIRRSSRAIYGMRLAVFLSLFFPIIVLDLLLFILGWSVFGRIATSSLVPLGWLVVVILLDYLVVRITWNRAIL
jgi:hypothetical protein